MEDETAEGVNIIYSFIYLRRAITLYLAVSAVQPKSGIIYQSILHDNYPNEDARSSNFYSHPACWSVYASKTHALSYHWHALAPFYMPASHPCHNWAETQGKSECLHSGKCVYNQNPLSYGFYLSKVQYLYLGDSLNRTERNDVD